MRVKSIVMPVLCLAVIGCSDDSGDLRPCPPNGLGVETHEGIEPAQQILEARQYNCEQPQICPDQGAPWMPDFVISPSSAPAEVNILLSNCSTGNARLVIEKVVIYGDRRCSFTEANVEKKEIDPGQMAAIATEWDPTEPGEDHAQFRVFSNAQNFPELKVPFCGRAYNRPTQQDAGVVPEAGIPDGGLPQPDLAPPKPELCEDVKDHIQSSCHSEDP